MRPLPTSSTGATGALLWSLVRRRWRLGLCVLVLVGLADVTGLVAPRLIGLVVDAVTAGRPHAGAVIDEAAAGFVGIIVVGALLNYLGQWKAAALGEDILASLRTKVFDHVISLPIETVEHAGTGDLVSRVTDDVNVLSGAARTTLPVTAFALIQLILAVVGLVLVSPFLAATAGVIAAPTILSTRWYLRRAGGLYRAERERGAEWAGDLVEAYRGAATLQALRAEGPMRDRLVLRGQDWIRATLATVRARNVLRSGVQGAQAVGLAAVIVVGAWLVGRRELSIGDVTAAALYLTTLVDLMSTLLDQLDSLQNAFAAAARLAGVLEEPTETASPPLAAGSMPAVGAAVELSDVTFGYGGCRPVVHSVDLVIGAGEHVALVGPSGAGKSTVARLIAGIHRPRSGSVTIRGQHLDELSASDIHSRLMLVAQDTHTFARSVADNIRLGSPAATDDEIRRSLEAVGAADWVRALPDGIHSAVGVGGIALTPGAGQQLALARLLCRDPEIAVLDEATAHMPVERALQAESAVSSALGARTIISVIHHLQSIRPTDRVIMIDQGAVVDDGHRDVLIKKGGPFSELWTQWLESRRPATP